MNAQEIANDIGKRLVDLVTAGRLTKVVVDRTVSCGADGIMISLEIHGDIWPPKGWRLFVCDEHAPEFEDYHAQCLERFAWCLDMMRVDFPDRITHEVIEEATKL